MKNFIVFIIVVSLLSVGGFVVYREYYKGESLNEAFQDMRGSGDKQNDTFAEAREAYNNGDYAEALKGFDKTLQAYETNEPGGDLEEQQHKTLLLLIADCYKKQWENSGKTDDMLRVKSLRVYEKYQTEYPGDMNRSINRGISEVRNPPTPSATEAPEADIDESPAK